MVKSSKSKASKVAIRGTPISTPRLLLVFDPAAACGIALFLDGRLVSVTPGDGSSFMSLLQAARPLLTPYEGIKERVAVIEQHWMSKWGQKGSLTLGQRRGIAQSVGEALGCTRWFYVPSSTWQSFAFDGSRPEDTKVASLERAKRFSVPMPTDDCADAANLGDYFLTECCTH